MRIVVTHLLRQLLPFATPQMKIFGGWIFTGFYFGKNWTHDLQSSNRGCPYADILKSVGKISTVLATPPSPGHSVRVAGIMSGVRRSQTKNGDGMCQLSLEDKTGSVEVVLFPKVYAKYLTRVDSLKPVVVSGQLGNKEGGVKIIADSLNILDNRHKVSEVRIQIDTKKCDDEFYQWLQKVLANFQGGCEVVFTFPEYELMLKIEPQHWIDATAEALQAIEEVVGVGTVQTVVNSSNC